MPRKGRPARRSSPPIQDSPCLRSKRSPRGVLHVETSQRDATSAAFDMSTLPAEPGDEHKTNCTQPGPYISLRARKQRRECRFTAKGDTSTLAGLKSCLPGQGQAAFLMLASRIAAAAPPASEMPTCHVANKAISKFHIQNALVASEAAPN